jgi:hypothetical protein
MMWLKACPRCLGDLISESDLHGSYVVCLQCGREFSGALASGAVDTRARGGSPGSAHSAVAARGRGKYF